ncbi:hypothetical protein CI109_102057 [Kwoniella shandongensis]|uniref:Uncharacterized protein n=1 Tax=Kwoniella shandongensis TaxID=1734106 RepID=A0A5M6BQJ0_9TREE|nr:uncharacterized protein CI109_006534 [Kwoniella shandongensis]KAA5525164.1 hypothetical protein CI109_006534 [Kwoniella shandongensis]
MAPQIQFFEPSRYKLQQQTAQQQQQQSQQTCCQNSQAHIPSKDVKAQSTQAKTQQGETTFNPIPTRLPPPSTTTRRAFISARAQQGSTHEHEKTTGQYIARQPSHLTLDQVQGQIVKHTSAPIINTIPVNTSTDTTSDTLQTISSMAFNFDFNMEPVEWDQFLVDADLGEKQASTMATITSNSPASCDSQMATPKSSESEQSAALDIEPDFGFDLNFGFDFPSVGISHRPEDVFNPADLTGFSFPDPRGSSDPTMTSTFGLSFGDFGVHTGLDSDAASQLGLTNLVGKLVDQADQPATEATRASANLADAYAILDKLLPASSSPTSIEPSQLSLPPSPAPLKRKASEMSEDSASAAKKRGRPPGSTKVKPVALHSAKRAYRRQSKSSSDNLSGSPAVSIDTAVVDGDESDAESDTSPVKLTASGKPSTARPKSVVPEKFLKDGSAQSILGMTITEIQSFPSFEELVKKVSPSLMPGAREFGERIAENRDKAKDAAKKSRDERRAKIERAEVLEKKVEELETRISGMTSVLLALVDRGILTKDQVKSFL